MSRKWSLRPCCTHNNAKNNALIWTGDIQLCELLVDEHFAPSLRPNSDSWPILQSVQNIEKWNSSFYKSACFDLKIGFPSPHVTCKHVVKFEAGLRLLTDSTADAKSHGNSRSCEPACLDQKMENLRLYAMGKQVGQSDTVNTLRSIKLV